MAPGLTLQIIGKLYNVIDEYLSTKYGPSETVYKINSYSVQPACDAGDNFLGAIYSVKFSISLPAEKRNENFDLILKSQILNEETPDSSSKYFWNILFTKEKMIYSDIVEKLENLGGLTLAPKLHHFFSEGEDYSCLILDNLISLDYYIPDFRTLTFEECSIIMESLARIHSLSLVLEAKDGVPIPEKYEFCSAELMFSPTMEHVMKPYVQNSYRGILKACEVLRPDLVGQLKKFNDDETVWARACGAIQPSKTSFPCVCHGDARLKNIFLIQPKLNSRNSVTAAPAPTRPSPSLLPPDDDGPTNLRNHESSETALRFIDFQLARYSSPLTDLIYFIYISTQREFRQKYLDTLLELYFQEFQNVLSQFPGVNLKPQVKAWNLDTLKNEFYSLKEYALVTALVFVPTVYLRPEDMDGSVSDMSAKEREVYLVTNRADIVANIIPKNEVMRERIFETIEEILGW